MAEPIKFPQVNSLWIGEGDVGELPVYKEEDENISCWELTMEERFEILSTGVIWLSVWGNHPAVSIYTESPFEPEKDGPLEPA